MKRKILFFALVAITLFSCRSKYQKLLKSSDYNAKYQAALEYYAEEEYFKAQTLFEGVISVYRGTEKAEVINYHIAHCYYHQQEYIMSGYYFENYTATFPTGDHVAECYFKAGESYKHESPKPSLDQEYTHRALEAYQVYLNKYPDGEHSKTANDEIAKLRKKLETKEFENAKLYHTLGDYKAAVIALKNCIKDYPDTDYHEELLYLILDASYELAENSVERKKYQRYESAVDEYYSYIDQYPNGGYAKKAETVYEDCMKFLKK